jgi:dipeptidyl aminopeptidase/acylaminoacyl peptidase
LHNFKIAGLPLARWSFVSPAFSPDQYDAASPTSKATKVPQRFLLLIGERDHAPLKDDFAEMFAALSSSGVEVDAREIPRKNHRKIMFDIDTNSDETTPAILSWLTKSLR